MGKLVRPTAACAILTCHRASTFVCCFDGDLPRDEGQNLLSKTLAGTLRLGDAAAISESPAKPGVEARHSLASDSRLLRLADRPGIRWNRIGYFECLIVALISQG